MSGEVRPDEAARALVEIGRRHDQVIEKAIIPWWYWSVVAALMIGLSAAVESRRALVIGLGVAGFVLGVLVATGWVVLGMVRNLQVRKDLLGPSGVLSILIFVASVNGITLPAAFLLEATGARYPATLATSLGAVIMVAGGPVLMRYLRNHMRANRSGGQR